MPFAADFLKETKRQRERGRCLHFADGTRCNEFISAHSIQRRGQLDHIAEGGHVFRLNADLSTLKRTGGKPTLKKIGVKKASAFAGFCKHHDNALFEPIDNRPLEANKEQVALYAFRSICRELFVKENAVRVLHALRNHPQLSDCRKSLSEASLLGHSRGLAGLEHHKRYNDEALDGKDYDEFEFTYFTSSSNCPLQLSGLLYPDFDFLGRELQDLANWAAPPDLITFFTAPTSHGWAFGFAWHASSNRSCVPFMQSLASQVAEGKKLEDALLRFSFSCCENHAFRISWWNGLSSESRLAVQERMLLRLDPTIPVPPDYLVGSCEGIADWKFGYVHTTLSTDAQLGHNSD